MKNKAFLIIFIIFLTQNVFAQNAYEEARYQDYYNNAVTLFKANKYSSAILEFRKVLRVKPYDNNVRNALVSSYLARAEYYVNKENNPKKAIIDLKNAIFYLKYWNSDNLDTKQVATLNQALKTLKGLENTSMTPAQRFDYAKFLRTQGEMGAAGYEFAQLFGNNAYMSKARENAGDIYKTLNNELDSINCYREAIQNDKKNPVLHLKYAVLMDSIGNEDAAVDEYNTALKYGEGNKELLSKLEELWLARTIENPKDAGAFVNLGTVLQKEGDIENAKAQYLKALALDNDNKTVKINLASIYVSENNYEEAIKLYDALLLKNPKDIELLTYKGLALEKLQKYNEALDVYNSILSIDSGNKNAKEALDDIIVNNFKGEDLIAYLEKKAKENPNDFSKQYQVAYELHKQGQLEKAITYYNKALTIDPKNADSYINLAQIYNELQNKEMFAKTVKIGLNNVGNNKKLLEFDDIAQKENSNMLYEKAGKLWEEGKYKEALSLYMQIKEETPEVLSAIASLNLELQNYKEALKYGNNTLNKTPNDINILYTVANAEIELKDYNGAKKHLEKILSISPDNNEAKEAIKYIEQEKLAQDIDNAVKLYEAHDFYNAILKLDGITKQDPQNSLAFYYKGLIYQEQKKLKEATIQFERAVNFNPEFTLGYYSLASILDEQEQYQKAVDIYSKFLARKKAEGQAGDEYSKYVAGRVKELKEYLKSNGKGN